MKPGNYPPHGRLQPGRAASGPWRLSLLLLGLLWAGPLAAQPADTDGDGMPDTYETANGLDPDDASDAYENLDGDLLPNVEEFQRGTDPRVADVFGLTATVFSTNNLPPLPPMIVDTDGDGMPDDYELLNGLDPADPLDGVADPDSDLSANLEEFLNGTNPRAQDVFPNAVLDDTCTVSILNRSVQVRPNGAFAIANVPFEPGFFRLRATCVQGGVTLGGQSDYFRLSPTAPVIPGPIRLGRLDPLPVSLQVVSAHTTFTRRGEVAQFRVTLILPDGTSRDASQEFQGTFWSSSNPNIAEVDANGLVTARARGAAIIQARNEGVLASFAVEVLIPNDADNDGLTDEYERANGFNPNDAADAGQDADNDQLSNLEEFTRGTNPRSADTDGDTLTDGAEPGLGTNPLLADTDGDGLSDGQEVLRGSNPAAGDTDGDGIGDNLEVQLGLSLTNANPVTTLQGRVIDTAGLPVADASVTVFNLLTTGSDAAGNFTLNGVPAGLGAITVVAQVVRAGQVLDGQSPPVSPVPGGVTSVGTLQVGLNAGTVAGQVTDPLGAPVPGALVTVTAGTDARTATADFAGRYRVINMTAGPLVVTARDFRTGLRGRATATLALNGSAAVNVQLGPFGTVLGSVLNLDNVTPVAAGVAVRYAGPNTQNVLTDPLGRYNFDFVPLGGYTVEANDTNQNRGRSGGDISATAQVNVNDITYLGRGRVVGVVRDGANNPVSGATVTLSSGSVFGGQFVVTTDPAGRYAVSNVFVGGFNVTAQSGQFAGFGSGAILQDGQTATNNLMLAPAASIAGVVFRPDGVTPVTNVQVTLLNNGLRRTTDTQGAFRFDALPLGGYTVEAVDPASNDRGRASTVLQTQGEVRTANVTLNGQGAVVVTVRDGRSNLVQGAQVQFTGQTVFGGAFSGVTSADGTVTFGPVFAGGFAVSATDPATGLGGSASGSVAVGATAGALVRLQSFGSVAGRVFQPDGTNPAAGITVRLAGQVTRTRTTGADGAFRFDIVPTSTYSLDALDSGGALRARATGLVLGVQDQAVVRDLTLIGVGTVEGIVRDDSSNAVVNVGVSLASQAPEFGRSFFARTDVNGRYTIGGVPVGPFTVSASATLNQQQCFGAGGGSVTAHQQTATADLQLDCTLIPSTTTLYDANNFAYNIRESAAIQDGGPGGMYGGDFGANRGGFLLDVIVGGTSHRFAGQGFAGSEEGGRELAIRQNNLGGLNVTRKVYVPRDGYFVRYLELLSNPSGGPITATVRLTSHFRFIQKTQGGFRFDREPRLVSTSSGDTFLDVSAPATRDHWVVIDDEADGDAFLDGSNLPSVADLFEGTNAPLPASTAQYEINFTNRFGRLAQQWTNVVIPPGGTVAFLHFGAEQTGRSAAQASVERLIQLPPEALAGLSVEEMAQVVNFMVPTNGVSGLDPLPPLTGAVNGRTLTGDGSNVVAHATVRFRSANVLFGRTYTFPANAAGQFSFAGALNNGGGSVAVPVENFTLTGIHPLTGDVSPVFTGMFPTGLLVTTRDVIFDGTGVLVGTVRRHNGVVVSQGSVRISGGALLNSVTLNIAANGGFRLNGLPAGVYTLVATAPVAQGSDLTVTIAVTQAAGQTTVVEVVMPDTGAIAGTLRREGGAGAVNLAVSLRGPDNLSRSTTTDTGGRFTFFDVPAVPVTLEAFDAFSNTAARGQTNAVVDQTVVLDLTLIAGGTVVGLVTAPNSLPVAGAQVTLTAGNGTFATATGADGRYEFPLVAPGVVAVRVLDPASSLRGRNSGTLALSGQTLTLNVALFASGTVTGLVYGTDGATPVAGATVQLSGSGSGSTTADALGQYLFDYVPLGSFTVTATDPVTTERGSVTSQLTVNGETRQANVILTPNVTLDDVVVTERNLGSTSAVFTVRLSSRSQQEVRVNFATAGNSASAAGDFQVASGTLVFSPGVTSQPVSVVVLGDVAIEPDEAFFVNLSGAVGATITDGQGRGTIVNDDGFPGQIDHFTWEPIPSPQFINQSFPVVVTARDAFNGVVSNFTGPVTLSGLVETPEAAVGAGNTAWNWPFATFYHDARCQSIYLASEIGVARRVTGLALDVASLPGQTMNNWTVRMKHTALAGYGVNPGWDGGGWTTVFQTNLFVSATGWVVFPFQTPFDFNGVDNLLIDFSFNNTFYTGDGATRSTDTVLNRSLYFRTDSGHGDPLAWAGATPLPEVIARVPNVRLLGSSGLAALSPTVSGPFVDGVWTGDLTVQQLATNLVLRAEDGDGHSGASGGLAVLVRDDLSVALADAPDPVPIGAPLTYTIGVTNSGPAPANGVTLTNFLPASVTFVSAAASQGVCAHAAGVVTCDLAAIDGGGNAVVTLVVTPTAAGTITNRAAVGRGEADPFAPNNSAAAVTTVLLPGLVIDDTAVLEGGAGTRTARFTVRLSYPSGQTISVSYGTANGSAVSGVDYLPAGGAVSFPPNVTTQTVDVTILSDTAVEPDETFVVNLSNPTGAILLDAQATGVIVNDDGLPGEVARFEWDLLPSPQYVNEPFAARITARDAFGAVASNFMGVVTLFARDDDFLAEFDPVIDPAQWSAFGGVPGATVLATNYGGSVSGVNALWLGGSVTRLATTRPLDTSVGGTVRFQLRLGNGSGTFWEQVDLPGEGVVLEFSTTGGGSWTEMGRFDASTYYNWTLVSLPIPPAAQSGATLFRWRQLSNSGDCCDHWALDDVQIDIANPVFPVTPQMLSGFVDGVWTGALTVTASGFNNQLVATDGDGHSGASNPFDVFHRDDLFVTLSDSPDPAPVGRDLIYLAGVTNTGPAPATDVTLVSVLPASVNVISAIASQGSCSVAASTVTCALGVLPGGAGAGVTLVVVPTAAGVLSSSVSVTRGEPDAFAGNNDASVATTVLLPSLAVSDATLLEGNAGTMDMVFHVSLSYPSPSAVSVFFATANGSAAAGADYLSTNRTLSFPPGTTNVLMAVKVLGDLLTESNETFLVNLSSPIGATVADGQGTGGILDDEIVADALVLTAESCSPPNGAIDPGETVTVELFLRNPGAQSATGLVATLLAGDNVLAPSAPQNYGALTAGGDAVSRTFTFTADGPCGALIRPTLQLQDGPNALGLAAFAVVLGRQTQVFQENFDTAPPGTVPVGWTRSPTSGANLWGASATNLADTAPNAMFSPEPASTINNLLTSPSLQVPTLNAQLSFRHLFNTQPGPDAGQLLLSIAGGSFTEIIGVGGRFVTGGYNSNQTWTGNSGGYLTTVVVLPTNAAGRSVQFRWRFFTDSAIGGGGWSVDTVRLEAPQCCLAPNAVDLAAGVTDVPDPVTVANPLTYTINVTNRGPAGATQVTVTNVMPAGFSFLSGSAPQGCAEAAGRVLCGLGALASNASAQAVITLIARATPGVVTNVFQVGAAEPDFNQANNRPAAVTTLNLPALFADNATVTEGNSGTTSLVFVVRLNFSNALPVSVAFATSDSSALAGSDYLPASGVLVFPPGLTTQLVAVAVIGDLLNEANETLGLNLSAATNATLGDSFGSGSIVNDDPLPTLSIGDVTVPERNVGLSNAVFPVTLSVPSGRSVTVNFATANGSAMAGQDYLGAAAVLTFAAGETNKSIAVAVLGDVVAESNETFLVNLTGPVNAALADAQGVGLILEDDGQPGQIDHFVWSVIASPQFVGEPFAVTLTARDAFDVTLTNFTQPVSLRAVSLDGFGGAQVRPGYVRSTAGQPWGGAGNENAMTAVFTNWQDYRYETVNAASLFSSNHTFLFLEGSDNNALAMSAFLNNHLPVISNWVAAGGSLFLNAAPNQGGSFNFGFGVTLNYSDSTDTATAANPLHPIFVGPYLPMSLSFSGSSFGHATVSGSGLTPLLANSGNGRLVLAELSFGAGHVVFGGMTLPQFHSPQPQATNLRQNILAYGAERARQNTLSIGLTPTVTGPFVDGVWTGPLTIGTPATNVTLVADDGDGHLGLANRIDIGVRNDLAVSMTDSPDPIELGLDLTYAITVTNTGPDPATGVLLTNLLSAQTYFLSAIASQGTCSNSGSLVICDLGSIPGGTAATVTVLVRPATDGVLASRVTVSRDGADPLPGNNSAEVTTVVPGLDSFRIDSLLATGSAVMDHNAFTGDDRGAIALSADRVFYSGDSSTARFAAGNLTGGAALGQVLDWLVSDLRTETLYSLGAGPTVLGASGGNVSSLVELDSLTGLPNGNVIALSSPFNVTGFSSSVGVFAGYGRVVVHNGSRVYSVALPSGVVTDLGSMPVPAHRSSEFGPYWGVAEHDGRDHYLVYVRDSATVMRSRVPDGLTTTVASFSNLSDMAAFTVSPGRNRWYFHYEGGGQFGGSSETLGYADASFSVSQVMLRDDLSLRGAISPATVVIGGTMTYTLFVSNTGPSAADAVVTNLLPAGVNFISATASQGACAHDAGVVTCLLGVLPAATVATVVVEATPLTTGLVTNHAGVTRTGLDFYLPNNAVALVSEIVLPSISVDDVFLLEGDSGAQSAEFIVRLDYPSPQTVSVAFATVEGGFGGGLAASGAGLDGVAVDGLDYLGTNGVVVFLPGETNLTIAVPVLGDLLNEVQEPFFLELSNATNALLNTSQAVCFIEDNDPLPLVSVGDVTVREGNLGTTNAVFEITLSEPSGRTVFVDYSTTADSATAGVDYFDQFGFLEFPPGETILTLTVAVRGDLLVESDETFFLNVFPFNADVADDVALGAIVNDDGLPGQIDHFEWSLIPSPQVVSQQFAVVVTAKDAANVTVSNFTGTPALRAIVNGLSVGTNLAVFDDPAFVDSDGGSGAESDNVQASLATLGFDVLPVTDLATGMTRPALVIPEQERGILAAALDSAATAALSNYVHAGGTLVVHGGTPRAGLLLNAVFGFALTEFGAGASAYDRTPQAAGTRFADDPATAPNNGGSSALLTSSLPPGSLSLYEASGESIVALTRVGQGTVVFLGWDWFDAVPVGFQDGGWLALLQSAVQERAVVELPVTPAALAGFVDGVWTGQVALLAAATNVALLADDGDGHVGLSNPLEVLPAAPAPGAAPPALLHPAMTGVEFSFSFQTVAGQSCVVEFTDDLQSPAWHALEIVAGDGTMKTYRDMASRGPRRFYRLRVLTPEAR